MDQSSELDLLYQPSQLAPVVMDRSAEETTFESKREVSRARANVRSRSEQSRPDEIRN